MTKTKFYRNSQQSISNSEHINSWEFFKKDGKLFKQKFPNNKRTWESFLVPNVFEIFFFVKNGKKNFLTNELGFFFLLIFKNRILKNIWNIEIFNKKILLFFSWEFFLKEF